MRILIFQDYLRVGGTEHHSLLLAEEGRKLGHEVRLITFRPGGTLQARARVKRVDTRALQPFDTGLNGWAPGWKRAIQQVDPDGILLMGRCANGYGERIKRAFPSCRVIGTMRTGRPLPQTYWRSLKQADAIIANSAWARDKLVRNGIDGERIQVIANSLFRPMTPGQRSDWRTKKREEQGFSEDTLGLVYCAAFIPGKNHVALLEALNQLDPASVPDWHLTLLGKGLLVKAVRGVARKLGLEERITFTGYQNPVGPWLAAADLYLSASMEESSPNAVMEAQNAGLPVIAFDVAGVGEVVRDGESGILVAPGEVGPFSKAVQELACHPERRAAMAAAARAVSEGYPTPEEQARETFGLFEHS